MVDCKVGTCSSDRCGISPSCGGASAIFESYEIRIFHAGVEARKVLKYFLLGTVALLYVRGGEGYDLGGSGQCGVIGKVEDSNPDFLVG